MNATLPVPVAPCRRVTASSLELATICPASHALPQVREPVDAWMADGTAIHAFIESAFADSYEGALKKVPKHLQTLAQAVDFPAFEKFFGGAPRVEVSVAWDPDTDTGRILGERKGRDYTGVRRGEIPGTIDALRVFCSHCSASPLPGGGWSGGPCPKGIDPLHRWILVVADWKTGRAWVNGPETNGQVRFYALAAARAFRASGYDVAEVSALVVRIDEDGEARPMICTFDEDGLDAIASDAREARDAVDMLAAAVRTSPLEPEVTIGAHCGRCHALAWCPGMSIGAQALMEFRDRSYPLTPEKAAAAWQLLKGLEQAQDFVKHALQAYHAAGGVIELPTGKIVREVQKTDTVMNFPKLLEVAAEFEVAEEVLKQAKITRTDLLEVLGGKEQSKKFMGRLAEIGGLHEVPRSGGLRELNPPKGK